MASPLPSRDLVTLGDMTWLEVRDAMERGKTTIIIPTGGIEANGPFLALAKHDLIVEDLAEQIARSLGNTLVAPVINNVPEGAADPPSGHMHYPGTISSSERTFVHVLEDTIRSLAAHGFRHIALLGDSGGNQGGLAKAAERMAPEFPDIRIQFVAAYYDNGEDWLAERGMVEESDGYHHTLRETLLLGRLAPDAVRMRERITAGLWKVNGVELPTGAAFETLSSDLAAHLVSQTATAIRAEAPTEHLE